MASGGGAKKLASIEGSKSYDSITSGSTKYNTLCQ